MPVSPVPPFTRVKQWTIIGGCWCFAGLGPAAPAGRAQAVPSAAAAVPAPLDHYLRRVLADAEIPGLAIGVVRHDSVLVAQGYGVRALGRPDPVDPHTVFDVASLTKAFTATAAAILVDRGLLRWDDPVRKYLPDLVLPTDTLTRSATVRDFLAHRTGLDPANMMWMLTGVGRAEVLRRMRFLRVVAPFRQSMVYSNLGYSVAGEALAAAGHTSYEALLRDLVIRPLRMGSTTWSYQQAAAMPNLAAGHATLAGRQQVIPRERQRQPVAPAAAVQSSVSDLTRWIRLHLNQGVLDGVRYVSDSAMRAMHEVQVPISTTPAMRAARLVSDTIVGYGMGWQIMDYRGHRVWWHTGNGNGQLAYLALFPDDRLGIVVLVNTWSAPQVHSAMVNRIADTYLGYEPRDWAAEVLVRRAAEDSARGANARAMAAMRSSAPPGLPLAAYAGRYDHPVFGPIEIRLAGAGLTLQMGEGELADLEYHRADAFYVVWRDPFAREYYGTHLSFNRRGDAVVSFATTMNRDEFTARKAGANAADPPAPDLTGVEAILGRWDLDVLGLFGVYPSWLEVQRSGFISLTGRFVGRIGGARPIGKLEWNSGVARFTIPPEWERGTADVRVELRPAGDSLVGTLVASDGRAQLVRGKRAPSLTRPMPSGWGAPVSLFNGADLTGWEPTRFAPNYWTVRDGHLVNARREGANLVTRERFQDFRLHAEFRLPRQGVSGIILRGRYWMLLKDSEEDPPGRQTTGTVYDFLTPNQNASLGPDVWQTMDVTLVGRRVTVMVNGKPVIPDQNIPGLTGSAIDSDEGAPGPIVLQGEETEVEFRNLTISLPVPESPAPSAGSCAADDGVRATTAVRARLEQWVRQANANDREGMREVWAPGLAGWFPRAALFGDSAAAAAAGVAPSAAQPGSPTFALVVDDIEAGGSLVVVHDVWTETRRIAPGRTVGREIRGSELWRCQPDGRWRIARYVSAPVPWRLVPE